MRVDHRHLSAFWVWMGGWVLLQEIHRQTEADEAQIGLTWILATSQHLANRQSTFVFWQGNRPPLSAYSIAKNLFIIKEACDPVPVQRIKLAIFVSPRAYFVSI